VHLLRNIGDRTCCPLGTPGFGVGGNRSSVKRNLAGCKERRDQFTLVPVEIPFTTKKAIGYNWTQRIMNRKAFIKSCYLLDHHLLDEFGRIDEQHREGPNMKATDIAALPSYFLYKGERIAL